MNCEFANSMGDYFVITDEGILTKDSREKETVFIPYGNITSVKHVAILRGIEIRYTDNRCFSYLYSSDEKKEIKECLKFLEQKRLQSKRGEVITAPIDDALKQTIKEKSSKRPEFVTQKMTVCLVIALIVLLLLTFGMLNGLFDSRESEWDKLSDAEKDSVRSSAQFYDAVQDAKNDYLNK